MKKILTGLVILTMASSMTNPILTVLFKTKVKDENKKSNIYQSYQSQKDWEEYIAENNQLLDVIRSAGNLDSNYKFIGTKISLNTLKDKNTVPLGTLMMNSEIQTNAGTPNMVSQHIIDNKNGKNPLTVNYDSKTVTSTTTITATISTSLSVSVGSESKMDVGFFSESVNTQLNWDLSASLTTSNSVEETITFDKFSTKVKPGDKEEVNYIVMQNNQTFNMVLKTKLNLNECEFNFKNYEGKEKSVKWNLLSNDQRYEQYFIQEIYLKNLHIGYDKGFIGANYINDPTIPIEQQLFDANNIFICIPMSFNLNGYTTLIKQMSVE